ncbi:dynamin family protein [Streptomyces sp. NPDC096132]|uniref:dynamin family protein n=1 Tax=Streptomyces sp. NPDC096132 TaxID=3366075 RepID=UPI00381F9841
MTQHSGSPEIFEELRREILALFPELTERARRQGAQEALTRLEAARERLTEGRLTVLVCGEFNRGKSTLLNALLGETGELCPVGASYTTNAVTTVSYGPEERIVVTLEHLDGTIEERPVGREEIARYASENAGEPGEGRVVAVQVLTPNERLAGGLTLVDTPGVGGVHREHTAATAAFLPAADALVFVTDVLRPLSESELAFLHRAMKAARTLGDVGGQVFVLNKTDALPDYREELRNTVDKLVHTTGVPAEQLTVVPVSSRARLDHLVSGDPEDLELSNFTALEDALWSALFRRRAQVLLGGALDALDACAYALTRPVEAEVAALSAQQEDELGRLTEQAEEQQRRLTELDGSGSQWRTALQSDLATMHNRLRREANDGLAQAWAQVNADHLYQDTYLDNPDRLLSDLTQEIAQLLGTANELAAREAARVVRDFSTFNGLTLTPAPIGRLPAPPVPALPLVPRSERKGDAERRKLMSSSAGLAAGSSAGAAGGFALGALVGTLVFPGLGTAAGGQWGAFVGSALGGVVGTAAGYGNAGRIIAQEQTTARREALRRALAPLRKEQQQHLDQEIRQLLAEWSAAVVAELDSRVAQARETAQHEQRRLVGVRELTARDALTRRRELDEELHELGRLRLRAAALAETAARLYGAAGTDTGDTDADGTDTVRAHRGGTDSGAAKTEGIKADGADPDGIKADGTASAPHPGGEAG